MRYLTLLTFTLALIFGLQPVQAQVDMTMFENLFNTNLASIGGDDDDQQADQPSQSDRDGGGNVDRINADWPIIGKMVKRTTKLTWSDGIVPTELILMQDSREILRMPVSGSSITIDFANLGLESGKNYDLHLTNGEKQSRPTFIQFVDASELDAAVNELENDIGYKKADGLKKKLMKAFFFQTKNLNYEAFEAYHIETADPDDMKLILKFFNDFKSET